MAAGTVDGDTVSTRDFREAFLDVVQGNVQAFGYMSGFPLAGIPDIEHQGRIGARGSSAAIALAAKPDLVSPTERVSAVLDLKTPHVIFKQPLLKCYGVGSSFEGSDPLCSPQIIYSVTNSRIWPVRRARTFSVRKVSQNDFIDPNKLRHIGDADLPDQSIRHQ
jgi:hypothetical protein